MNPISDRLKHFGTLKTRNLRASLSQCIAEQFPRIGGERITNLCADIIIELISQHFIPREHITSGQVRWLAHDLRLSHGKARYVCVTLDLITPEDIEQRIAGLPAPQRLLHKIMRLCRQAHEQKALLSNSDLAELLNIDPSYIGKLLSRHEQQTGEVVPRRATLHDVGTAMTHKGIICRKRYLDGKEPNQIARETSHSLQAVDRYLGQFERVRACAQLGMSPQQTAHILNCSVKLVDEYLLLLREIEEARLCSRTA